MSAGETIGGFYGRKQKLLLFAAVLVAFGLLASVFVEPHSGTGNDPRQASTQWQGKSQSKLAIEESAATYGDAAMRFGASFGIAMVLASLLRAFLKTMATIIAVTAVVIFVFYSQGWVDPFWEEWIPRAGHAREWAIEQTRSIGAFVKGHVPSMGAALVGFGCGLKR